MTFSTKCVKILIILKYAGVLKMFFSTKDTIPAGMGFKTFGLTHLCWLAVIIAMCVSAVIIYRKLSPQKRNIMRNIIGWTILGLEIIKDIVAFFVGDLDCDHLPLHLCGINILLIGFDMFKPVKTVRNFLYYFCIPGALLALFFPNWTVLPCMNFFHMNSFLIHAFLVMYPLMLVCGGDITPEIKMMPKCISLLICMAIPIYFVNMLCDTNFMFLMEPETGNPLGLFEKYLGNHLFGFPILLPIVMFIMYLPLFITSKLKRKKADEKQEDERVLISK